MERFLRDFSLVASVLLLPLGIYCLHVAMETTAPNASLCLIVGAALSSTTFFSLCCAIRKHLIMREYQRYLRGKQERSKSSSAS
jgi:hypothetical protein